MAFDDDWYEQNFRAHEPLLRAWLARRFPSLQDVDDIVQESYLRLVEAHSRTEIAMPKAYLFRVARNLVLDRLRHEKVIAFEPLVEGDASDVEDEGASVHQTVTRDQRLEIMTQAIQALPTQCRHIFTLRKVHGLSQQEIAQRLGISQNTVSAQLTIGLNKCRQYVASRLGPLD
jgi:RNA polymerase sigma-70 factor (ECF subfamily)